MNLKRRHWLLLGAMVATSLASIILGVISLSGFPGPGDGDSLASARGALVLSILVIGAVAVVGRKRRL